MTKKNKSQKGKKPKTPDRNTSKNSPLSQKAGFGSGRAEADHKMHPPEMPAKKAKPSRSTKLDLQMEDAMKEVRPHRRKFPTEDSKVAFLETL